MHINTDGPWVHRIQQHISERIPLIAGVAPASHPILAGGAIRSIISGQPVSDYDLFFRGKKDVSAFRDGLHQLLGTQGYDTDNCTTYVADGVTLQVIQKIFGDPKTILCSFDFTVCMAAYDLGTRTLYTHARFESDLMRRRLVPVGIVPYPASSIIRAVKYAQRGFTIGNLDMIKLLGQFLEINPSSPEQWAEAVGGVDLQLLDNLLGARSGDITGGELSDLIAEVQNR